MAEPYNVVVKRAILWSAKASEEIRQAGGRPEAILSNIPESVLYILMSNNLHIKYVKPAEEDKNDKPS